ncbi:MAG: mannose-6-phosphate isomerase, partial [Serratia symbiotica]|nr:mannose-6-phosphate isomerase [Serratia symbiotica]
PASALLVQPEQRGNELFFPIPVEDFAFSLHELTATPQALVQNSAAIVFCVNGEAVLEKQGQQWVLKPGRSCFIGAFESPVNASGNGRIARVYNQLP